MTAHEASQYFSKAKRTGRSIPQLATDRSLHRQTGETAAVRVPHLKDFRRSVAFLKSPQV
jgi:hypothetical protein